MRPPVWSTFVVPCGNTSAWFFGARGHSNKSWYSTESVHLVSVTILYSVYNYVLTPLVRFSKILNTNQTYGNPSIIPFSCVLISTINCRAGGQWRQLKSSHARWKQLKSSLRDRCAATSVMRKVPGEAWSLCSCGHGSKDKSNIKYWCYRDRFFGMIVKNMLAIILWQLLTQGVSAP